MKLVSLLCIVLAPLMLSAQESTLNASAASWKGWQVQFVTRVEPPAGGPARLPGGVVVGPDRVHHTITDAANRRRFGYDLLLEPVDERTVRLRIEPLSRASEPGWTLLGPPKLAGSPVLRDGETAALDLLVNPATGQRVVEYLTLRRSDSGILNGAPRDFTPDDVELVFEQPRLWKNGKLVEATKDFATGITAHVLWFYLAGDGQFVLSLWPNPELGFQKAGVIGGRMLRFQLGGAEYRVECARPIAPGSGLYALYVSRSATCCTFGPGERFSIGGADKAEYLIRKR